MRRPADDEIAGDSPSVPTTASECDTASASMSPRRLLLPSPHESTCGLRVVETRLHVEADSPREPLRGTSSRRCLIHTSTIQSFLCKTIAEMHSFGPNAQDSAIQECNRAAANSRPLDTIDSPPSVVRSTDTDCRSHFLNLYLIAGRNLIPSRSNLFQLNSSANRIPLSEINKLRSYVSKIPNICVSPSPSLIIHIPICGIRILQEYAFQRGLLIHNSSRYICEIMAIYLHSNISNNHPHGNIIYKLIVYSSRIKTEFYEQISVLIGYLDHLAAISIR